MLLIPIDSRGTVAAVSEDHMVTMAALRLISLYTIVVLLSTVGMYVYTYKYVQGTAWSCPSYVD